MADVLPAEAPFTLRDILELLDYRVRLAKYDLRSQSVLKHIYTDQPGRSASTQAHSAMMWTTLNYPHPGRLTYESAPSLPLYRRLLKTARRDYESDLDSTLLPVILSDVIEGTPKTLAEVWEMPADEFERFWNDTENPLSKTPSPVQATSPEVVDDLDLLRAEVAALHVLHTSRKPDGETVSKIINNPDLLQRIARHGKGTDQKSLARFLHSCLQPKTKPGRNPT